MNHLSNNELKDYLENLMPKTIFPVFRNTFESEDIQQDIINYIKTIDLDELRFTSPFIKEFLEHYKQYCIRFY